MPWIPLIAAVILATIHFVAGKLRFLDVVPRSRWLSFGGGVSIAYVFIHLLPDIHSRQESFARVVESFAPFLKDTLYLTALLGLVTFLGLEQIIRVHRRRNGPRKEESGEGRSPDGGAGKGRTDREGVLTEKRIYWLHVGMYVFYNATIGHVLVDFAQAKGDSIWPFAGAMALHFLVVDYGLSKRFEESYRHRGREVLSGAILLGWLAGWLIDIPKPIVSLSLAILAGGIILNVLKEELPEERASRFRPFLGGAIGYTILLLVV